MPSAGQSESAYCSFCAKSRNEVAKLIAGPTVFICDECVELCTEICLFDVPEERAKAARKLAEQWVNRTAELRRILDALSSSDLGAIEPIRGRWLMHVGRDRSDGSVRVILRRQSPEDGDVSITFDETQRDLLDIAECLASIRDDPEPSHAMDSAAVEGIEMSVFISGKALLHECQRRIEHLKLSALLPPAAENAFPSGMEEIVSAIDAFVERHPEQRRNVGEALQAALHKLAYTR
jgi:hypothetical protein